MEAIKAQRRVAAMIIGNASVASFDEGVLTLRFPRQGDVKGFQGGKYEDLLKQVLNTMFGVNVVIRAVTGGGDAPSPGPPPGPGPGPRRAARASRLPARLPASRRPGSRRPARRHRTTRAPPTGQAYSAGPGGAPATAGQAAGTAG